MLLRPGPGGSAAELRMRTSDVIRTIVAAALIWVSINMVATAYQPGHAGSVVATLEIGLSLIVVIMACFFLRPR
jgi:hypothetical protein